MLAHHEERKAPHQPEHHAGELGGEVRPQAEAGPGLTPGQAEAAHRFGGADGRPGRTRASGRIAQQRGRQHRHRNPRAVSYPWR